MGRASLSSLGYVVFGLGIGFGGYPAFFFSLCVARLEGVPIDKVRHAAQVLPVEFQIVVGYRVPLVVRVVPRVSQCQPTSRQGSVLSSFASFRESHTSYAYWMTSHKRCVMTTISWVRVIVYSHWLSIAVLPCLFDGIDVSSDQSRVTGGLVDCSHSHGRLRRMLSDLIWSPMSINACWYDRHFDITHRIDSNCRWRIRSQSRHCPTLRATDRRLYPRAKTCSTSILPT